MGDGGVDARAIFAKPIEGVCNPRFKLGHGNRNSVDRGEAFKQTARDGVRQRLKGLIPNLAIATGLLLC
jgi:hypothetical protein